MARGAKAPSAHAIRMHGSRAADRVAHALDHLLRRPGVEGAVLVSRDGLPLACACPGVGDGSLFAAMQAAALGAAEMALQHLDTQARVLLLMESPKGRFLARAVSDDLLVVVRLAPGADCHEAARWAEEAGAALRPRPA